MEDWTQREKRAYTAYAGLASDADWTASQITDFVTWLAAKRDTIQDDQLWREAVINECAIAFIGWNIENPRGTIAHLIDWHVQLALDPAVSEPAAKLVAEANHWRANHAEMVRRAALLSQRPDLPVDRIPAYDELVRLQQENAQLRAEAEADAALIDSMDEMLHGVAVALNGPGASRDLAVWAGLPAAVAKQQAQLDAMGDLQAAEQLLAMLASGNARINLIEDATVAPNAMLVELPGGRTLSLDVTDYLDHQPKEQA